MKTLTVALKRGLCVLMLSTAIVHQSIAQECEPLCVLSHDIIVLAKQDSGLRARIAQALDNNATIIDLPSAAIYQKVKGLNAETIDKVCKTLNEQERSTLMAHKFHELLNPTRENERYNIIHYADMLKYLCEKTEHAQFKKQHAQFIQRLTTCAQQVVRRGLMYLLGSFQKDLQAAFDSLTNKVTSTMLAKVMKAEMAKHGKTGLIKILRSRSNSK